MYDKSCSSLVFGRCGFQRQVSVCFVCKHKVDNISGPAYNYYTQPALLQVSWYSVHVLFYLIMFRPVSLFRAQNVSQKSKSTCPAYHGYGKNKKNAHYRLQNFHLSCSKHTCQCDTMGGILLLIPFFNPPTITASRATAWRSW